MECDLVNAGGAGAGTGGGGVLIFPGDRRVARPGRGPHLLSLQSALSDNTDTDQATSIIMIKLALPTPISDQHGDPDPNN